MEERENIAEWLRTKIAECTSDGDEVSWGYEEGILISKNDANRILELLSPAAKEPTDLTKTEPMEERDNITIICGWLGGNTPRAIAARKFMDGLLEEIHKLSHPSEEQEYPLMCRECGKLKTDDGNLICLCPKEPTDLTKICPHCNKYKKMQGNGMIHQLCECGVPEPITAEEVPCYNCKELECRCVEETEIDCVLKLVNDYWKFDNNQQPMSSWHDKQDLLKAIAKIGPK